MIKNDDLNIKTVTIVGANGTMGTNIAGIFASFGNADVFMVCRDFEKSKTAIEKAYRSVRADSIKNKLHPADYSMLADCVKVSDLVFESVAEKIEIKEDITKQIASNVKPDAIVCSGTSGLSINAIASCLPQKMRSRYYGVHMFNPPYSLCLCELIPSADADSKMTELLAKYLRDQLKRTVVFAADEPAFLANRIGFHFLNKALQYAEKYKLRGGVDYIDSILDVFSGRLMPPLATIDFVGLDIHLSIVDNVFQNANDYEKEAFLCPQFVKGLIEQGKKGRKTGEGLYKTVIVEGKKEKYVYDIVSKQYRKRKQYDFSFSAEMNEKIREGNYKEAIKILAFDKSDEANICLNFLIDYIVYSLNMANSISNSLSAADDAMATGFNWCPPLALYGLLSTVIDVEERAREFEINGLETDVFSRMERSKYDYRPFFRVSK